jgi:hypothetical protein
MTRSPLPSESAQVLGLAPPDIDFEERGVAVAPLAVPLDALGHGHAHVRDGDATAASMTNYLTPVVAALLGIAFVHEPLSLNLIIGTAVILVGLWIAERNSNEREVANDTLKLSEDEARGRERI